MLWIIPKLLFTAINSKNYSKYYGYGRNMYRGLLSYAGKWGLIFFWIFGCGCQPIFIFFGDSLSFWGNQNMILQSHLIIRNGYLASEQPGSSEPFSMPNLSVYFINCKPQCPRADLNKRFLPRANTTTAWKLIPHRSNISKN